MVVQLKGALDQVADTERLLLRGCGTREFEEILHDARRAAGLAMRQIELALGGIVEAFALAQEFRYSQNGGEGIVQLVRDASKHLPHGREFLSLDELLFQALEIGYVTAGNDYAIDLASFVAQRAEMAADAAPLAKFVADANFQRSEGLAPIKHFGEQRLERRAIFHMSALAELLRIVIFGIVAEDFFDSRACESVTTCGVQHENEIREAIHQAPREFLLLVEAAFHFAALGDIHQRAVI